MDNKNQKVLKKDHTVEILSRKKINIVGTLEVLSSTDKEATIKLEDGYMVIVGTGLSILKLIPEEESVSFEGNIGVVKYISKLTKKSFFGKVFK